MLSNWYVFVLAVNGGAVITYLLLRVSWFVIVKSSVKVELNLLISIHLPIGAP